MTYYNYYSFTSTKPINTKPGKVLTYCRGLRFNKSHVHRSYCHVMSYDKFLHFHEIHNHQTCHRGYLGWGAPTHKIIWHLITQPPDVTLQIRNVLSYLPQDLLPTNLVEWRLKVTGFHPLSYVTLSSCGQVTSRDRFKNLYLFFHITYDNHTFQDRDSG